MDKESIVRTIIAIGLCLVFFVVWNMFFAPKPVPQQNATTQSTPEGNAESATPIAPPVPIATTNAEPPILLQTDDYEIGFDSESGDIRFVALHAYKGTAELAPRFMRIDNKNANYASFNAAGLTSGYIADATDTSNGVTTITFTAESEQLRVAKSYTLTPDSYEVGLAITVTNLTDTALAVPLMVQVGSGLGEGFEEEKYVFAGPLMGNKDDYENKLAAKVKDPISLVSPQWGGYTSKYFLFAVMSNAFEKGQIVKQDASAITQLSTTLNIAAGESSSISDGKIFVGPKHYNVLSAYGIGLQKSIDFGMFFFLGIPMSKVMNFFYGFVQNYGIAIILLTIVVKLITLPLTLKSMKSMRAMSKLQPEIKNLREKYKNDPQRLNAATMEMYKKHGANPVSGCLPMIIQLPVFVALYKALLVSIELKGAPFFGWIVDLSLKDPYYITPLLMGASMFLTQKMTPSTMDPTQQKIMMIMPIVFTFLFLNFPAGLVVYWLTNNILSIIQQYIINRQNPQPATAK